MLTFLAAYGLDVGITDTLQEAVAEALGISFENVRSRWVDLRQKEAEPGILSDPTTLASESTTRFEEQVREAGNLVRGSWSVIVMAEHAPLGLMLALYREVERCTGNAPGAVIVRQNPAACEVVHVCNLPLRSRCRVGETLYVVRNIWVHHSTPFLVRGAPVTVIALDGPGAFENCVAVRETSGDEPARLLLPWSLVASPEEWAEGAYPNGGPDVPLRLYPPLIQLLQHGMVDNQPHFWHDWPAVRPLLLEPDADDPWYTVRFAW
jgi:hypothetical protein